MKDRQDNLEKLLEEELKKEADQILAELEADESLKNVELPDNLDVRMMERIRKIEEEKEAEARLSEKDREALWLGREMQMLRGLEDSDEDEEKEKAGENGEPVDDVGAARKIGEDFGKRVVFFRKKRRKAYVLAAVVAILVMAIGVTSVGEAPMFTKVGGASVGNREIVQIDSMREGKSNVQTDSNEIETYEKIKKEFGVDVVKLQYKPDDTYFLTSDIDVTLKKVCLLYQYNDSIIEYQIMFDYLEQSSGYDVEDVLVKEENIIVSKVPINIKTYDVKEENREVMVAKFQYLDAYYILQATLSDEEFLKIIKNLNFY